MTELPENRKMEYLGKTELFSLCSEKELSIVARNSGIAVFRQGKRIFSPGDGGNSLYVVIKGEVAISKPDNEERMTEIARFVSGDFFGELEMLTEASRTAFATADSYCRILVFPEKGLKFSDFLADYPDVSARILHKFIVQISGRIRKTNALVKENTPVMRELSRQVYSDKLTGLENKTSLEEKLKSLLDRGGAPEKLSLIMFKPDNFKEINDTFGHDAGDLSLRIMARSIREFLPEGQTLFRYMGNELAVLMPGCGRAEALDTAAGLLDFIRSLDLGEATGGAGFSLSASFGIAVYPGHASLSEQLIQKAHQLPLAGRALGGGKILFPEDLDNEMKERT